MNAKKFYSSSTTYQLPIERTRYRDYEMSRSATILKFIESEYDIQSMSVSHVPGVSLEIAEVFRGNQVELVCNLIGLALLFIGPSSDVEEAAKSFMKNLIKNYGVIDDKGLITEAIFQKIDSLMNINELPSSNWFERAGNEINFYAGRDLLINHHPQAQKLRDVFLDYKFSSYILGSYIF